MSTRLYEELGISSDATPEQVRKAYKKKALLTHPDRLPQGATAEQKTISEEKFRKVNNAYEVLIDPKKRQEYDLHGIWPAPEEQPSPTAQAYGPNYGRWPPRSNTFPDPFMSHRTGFSTFQFSDPFSLFEQIFAGTAFARSSSHRHPFFSQSFDPFGHMDIDDLLDETDRDIFGMRGFPSFSPFPQFPALSPLVSSSFSSGNGTRWVSESFSSSMVNGVTQSVHKRIDSEGNEHVNRTFSDGSQIRTINGVEQPSQQHVSYPQNQSRHLLEPSTSHYPPQPFTAPQLLQNDPRNYVASPPSPYATPSQSQGYYVRQNDGGPRPRHHHSRDKHRRWTEHNEDPTSPEERHARKKWWPSRS